jgi:hypothetical protein
MRWSYSQRNASTCLLWAHYWHSVYTFPLIILSTAPRTKGRATCCITGSITHFPNKRQIYTAESDVENETLGYTVVQCENSSSETNCTAVSVYYVTSHPLPYRHFVCRVMPRWICMVHSLFNENGTQFFACHTSLPLRVQKIYIIILAVIN